MQDIQFSLCAKCENGNELSVKNKNDTNRSQNAYRTEVTLFAHFYLAGKMISLSITELRNREKTSQRKDSPMGIIVCRTYRNRNTYTHINTYPFIHPHPCTYTPTHTHIHTHQHTPIYIHTNTHLYTHTHTHTHTNTHPYTNIPTRTHIHAHKHTPIYIHTHAPCDNPSLLAWLSIFHAYKNSYLFIGWQALHRLAIMKAWNWVRDDPTCVSTLS